MAVASWWEGPLSDLYVIDVARNVPRHATSDPGDEMAPVFSADGTHVYFASSSKGSLDIFQRSAGGAGAEELLLESKDLKRPTGVLADGRFLLYDSSAPREAQRDIWALSLAEGHKSVAVVQTKFDEGGRHSLQTGAGLPIIPTTSERVRSTLGRSPLLEKRCAFRPQPV